MKSALFFGLTLLATISASLAQQQVDIKSAKDWGGGIRNYPASNAIDGSTAWSSRWSASDGNDGVSLELDLGSVYRVDDVAISWGHGDDYKHRFEIRGRKDSDDDWKRIISAWSSGKTESFENYNVEDMDARYVRVKVFENDGDDKYVQNIKEVKVYSTGSSSSGGSPSSSEDPPPPSPSPPSNGSYDLRSWKLTVPEKDEIEDYELPSYLSQYFFKSRDGGLTFKCPVKGGTTSGSSYTRVELREMLRRGNKDIDTSDKKNNWALSSIPASKKSAFGGIDGKLEATLSVNKVTTSTSDTKHRGRIIIGQIHAKNNEPCRLYYHKQPDKQNGAIYFASESESGSEKWYDLLGDARSNNHSNPSGQGIPLNQKFSYKIETRGNSLTVSISQNGRTLASKQVTMSGYDDEDNYMYFKAGVYMGDNKSSSSDYSQATFYSIKNTH